jgi:hypothetical protein
MKLTIALLLSSFIVTAQNKISLQVPENFTQKSQMNMDMAMKIFGKGMDSKSVFYSHTNYKGLDENKNLQFAIILDSFKMVVDADDKMVTINSNDAKSMEEFKNLATMKDYLGKEVSILVNSNGKVIKNEEEKLPNYADGIFIELPSSELKVKDTWTLDTKTEVSGIPLETTSKYTIMSITDSEIKILAEATSDMTGDDPIVTNYIIDAKTGMVKSYKTSADTKVMGMKMKMKMNFTTFQ